MRLTDAQRTLVEDNMGLAVFAAQRYFRAANALGVDIDDILQEARIGVMKAAYCYDPEICAFSTYAVGVVRRTVINALNKHCAERKREGEYALGVSLTTPKVSKILRQTMNRYGDGKVSEIREHLLDWVRSHHSEKSRFRDTPELFVDTLLEVEFGGLEMSAAAKIVGRTRQGTYNVFAPMRAELERYVERIRPMARAA